MERKAVEFDLDDYQKFKFHHYVQKSCVPTPTRAPITILKQSQTFSKKSDLCHFLYTVCCDIRCNTNQLGKITNHVKKLLTSLNYK